MTQKNLFEQYGAETEHIWYYIGSDDALKKEFLQFARNQGLHWMNGAEINPDEDACGAVMGVDRKGRLGQVSLYLWSRLPGMSNRDSAKRIEFATGRWFDRDGYMESKIIMTA